MSDRIVRMNELPSLVGLSERSIYRREAVGEFPARLKLGPNAIGWRLSDIETWIASRPTVQDQTSGTGR